MIHHPDSYMGWGMGWGMWFIPLLIILGVYFVIRNSSQNKISPNEETPLKILEKRYAKGEITREQYEEIKKDLSM